MKYLYKIGDDIFEFKCSNGKYSGVIKRLLSRNDIDIYEHLKNLGFELRLCNICKKEFNPHFDMVFEVNEDHFVKIIDIKWGKSSYNYEKYNKHYCYGSNVNCPGLNMNPNSVDFISRTMNLSKDEAIKYIHKNNKSPFYRTNHESDLEYSKSQSRGIDFYISRYGNNVGTAKYQSCNNAIKYSNSKESYINRYGNIDGTNIWNDISKKKAITLANLQKKYGDILGQDKYDRWRNTCSKSNASIIEKYGKDEGFRRIEARNKKRIQSLIENGHIIIPRELRFEFMIYSQLVWDETKYNILLYGKDKFGFEYDRKSSLTVDHRFSIKNGFLNDIPPEVIGNIENLEYLSKSDNCKKRSSNSIELDELIKNIEKSKYGK